MKIKNLSILALSAMAMGLASCSDDEPAVKGSENTNGGKFYATVQLNLPGSRSETYPDKPEDYQDPSNSNHGYEVGKTYENNVNNVVIVMATRDAAGNYNPVACSDRLSATPATGSEATKPVFNIVFQQKDIDAIASQEVYLFAYCNVEGATFSEEGMSFNNNGFINNIGKITSAAPNQGIWKRGNFLMVNAANISIESLKRTIPGKESLEKNYNTPEKALNLGTIDVARAAARFDFKSINDNKYEIRDINANEDGTHDLVATVKVLEMAPLNIAHEFYMFPRVSTDGTDTNWEHLGYELSNNWVVSPNFGAKGEKLTAGSDLLNKYFFQSPANTYDDTKYYEYTNIEEFLKNGEDHNETQWNEPTNTIDKSGYKIWRYVTENTLPEIAAQKKGISTGVVFKAEILSAENSLMADAMDKGEDIYSYDGTIYGSLANLREFVAGIDPSNPLYLAFNKVFNPQNLEINPLLATTEDGNFTMADNQLAAYAKDLANNNTFKIYRATNEADGYHYYIYYLYRNRHNNNGIDTSMGAMEFGTVRNNIYKLSITGISEFGHTADPDDDPDPEDPDDPDEEPKTYIKVACRVVPWMVRVNNIEF